MTKAIYWIKQVKSEYAFIARAAQCSHLLALV
jgi:hypothetical protein